MQFWPGLFNMLIEVKEIIKNNEISHSCKSKYAHNICSNLLHCPPQRTILALLKLSLDVKRRFPDVFVLFCSTRINHLRDDGEAASGNNVQPSKNHRN